MGRETLTIRWTADSAHLGERLSEVARRTNRPSADYVRDSVAAHIDQWEHEADVMELAADIRSGNARTIPSEEVYEKLGILDGRLSSAELAEVWNEIE